MTDFLKRWRHAESSAAVSPAVPLGQRIYCVGDIHGQLDLLQQLHERILEDASGFTGEKTLVYLGDYIDRGEHSREVIELLLASPLDGFRPVYLLGNHEQTLLDFLQHPRAVAAWLTYGGRATLRSYGVATSLEPSRLELDDARDELERRLPQEHLEFYQRLVPMHVTGSYCFVHAGVRPGVPLQEQRNEDLLWIREDFTESRAIHEHIVVHGHTIAPEVEWRPNRIGIDTGAFISGVLTCLVLEGGEQRVLQTSAKR